MGDFDCIVIGAGLAGLTAARYLQSAGIETLVIEASDRPGGRVKSDLIGGFTLDHGFQVINPRYRNIRNSGVMDSLRFTPIVKGLIPFRVVEGASHPKDLMTPFLRGVFLTEPSQVSRRVRFEIYKGFIEGRPGLVDGGASAFSNALAQPVTDIHYGETVHRIDDQNVVTDHGTYRASYIVIATDPVTETQLAPEVGIVRMNASTTWYHSTDDQIEGARRFAVTKSGSVINSVAISDIAVSYAPAGKQLFSSTSLLPISESEVRRELSRIWRTDTSSWEFVARYEIKKSLPVHPAGKPLYSPVQVDDRLYVAGDHRGYPSQQGAMESGKRAAQSIIERVHPRR
jgi:phytoene dehydrogenase-like protein